MMKKGKSIAETTTSGTPMEPVEQILAQRKAFETAVALRAWQMLPPMPAIATDSNELTEDDLERVSGGSVFMATVSAGVVVASASVSAGAVVSGVVVVATVKKTS